MIQPSISLVSTGASYFITEDWLTIEVLAGAARSQHSRSPRQRQRQIRNGEIRREARGPITSFTEDSYLQLRRTIHNLPPFLYSGTLTFPVDITDGRFVKRCIDRLGTWILRKWPVSLLWKLEFQESGRPHVMILLTGPIAFAELEAKWSALTAKAARIELGPIRDYRKQVAYLLKPVDHYQNQVPPDFTGVGRFWGVRGPLAHPKPLLKLEGPEIAMSRVLRLLRKIIKARIRARNPKARMRRDLGFVGRYYWHGGGESVARALERYAIALGLPGGANSTEP